MTVERQKKIERDDGGTRDDGGARGDKEIKRASETNLSMELQYLFDTMEGVVYHKR